MDKRRNPETVELRLCIGDPPIAYMDAADLNTTGFKMKDVVDFGIVVDHAHRRQGLGGLLYEKALEFARERGAKRLTTGFREWSSEEPAIAFLSQRGFAEMERDTPSFLDLTAWDPAPFQASVSQAAAYGARIFSYADAGDTEEHRHTLYDLQRDLIYDIPRRDEQPFTFEPYDDWLKFVMTRPDWRPDLLLLAEVGGQWVAQCHVMPKMEFPHVGMQWLTGVLKAHRGQGIATALKVRAYELAREAGVTVMTTDNHVDNAPMLAINTKFGFQPEPSSVMYNKVLDEQP